MLGEKIGETTGKMTGQRVLEAEAKGATIEATFQTTGKVLGVDINEIGTYWQTRRDSGALHGEGHGVWMTKDGEVCCWRGTGTGKPTGKGMGVTFRGSLSFETTSTKLSRLNSVCAVFEYEVDEHGNTKAGLWEWK